MRFRHVAVVGASLCLLAAACSVLLDLQPPPSAGADSGEPDSPPGDALPGDGRPSGDGSGVECALLDAALPDGVADAPTTFYPVVNVPLDDAGTHPWSFFDTSAFNVKAGNYQGAVFDGRYLYFAPRGNGIVTRYDTTSNFGSSGSWQGYDLTLVDSRATGFRGAVFDGHYVYFVPDQSLVVRFDTQIAFGSNAAWSAFDTATLPAPDSGPPVGGFAGGVFDGRYVYFVPYEYGTTKIGRVVRYDPQGMAADGGAEAGADAGADAGDATSLDGGDAGTHDASADAGDGAAGLPTFSSPSQWATFDTTTTQSASALGFYGGVFDGRFVYFVPNFNGGQSNGGASGVVSRYDTTADSGFTSKASWYSFDSVGTNPDSYGFVGAAFDGRYVYFAPHLKTLVSRFDTHAPQLSTGSAWSSFELTTVLAPFDAGPPTYFGTAFDGRFVYFVPGQTSLGSVVRYDTLSTFTSSCAWSQYDVSRANASATDFQGAVYDGRYLYLVPRATIVARFDTKSATWMPALPAFSGSTL
jgi:hypothetical protein